MADFYLFEGSSLLRLFGLRYINLYSNKDVFKTIADCDVQGVTGNTYGFAASSQVNEAIKIILKMEDVCEGANKF